MNADFFAGVFENQPFELRLRAKVERQTNRPLTPHTYHLTPNTYPQLTASDGPDDEEGLRA